LKNGADPRTRLELALVKAAAPEVDHSTRALLTRLSRLEAALEGGTPPPPATAPIAPPEAAPAPQRNEEEPRTSAGTVDLDGLRDLWPAVTETLRPDKPALAGLLAEAKPVSVDGQELVIAFPTGATFKKRLAEDRANTEALAGAVRTVAGAPLRPRYELREGLEPDAAPEPISEEEWIERFKQEFNAEEI
jgi:DNA polymerase III subunit gamma/tau